MAYTRLAVMEVMKSACILDILLKPTEFADGLDAGFERKGEIQEDPMISGQNR